MLQARHLPLLSVVLMLAWIVAPAIADEFSAEVVRVVDGDTIVVRFSSGKEEKVRLIGLDCPETRRGKRLDKQEEELDVEEAELLALADEASAYAEQQLLGKTIRLEYDVDPMDRWGRILAYVWLGERLFNEVLLEEGLAMVATYPPNVKYQERLLEAQRQARRENRGLWGTPPSTPTPTPQALVHTRSRDRTHARSHSPLGALLVLLALLLVGTASAIVYVCRESRSPGPEAEADGYDL